MVGSIAAEATGVALGARTARSRRTVVVSAHVLEHVAGHRSSPLDLEMLGASSKAVCQTEGVDGAETKVAVVALVLAAGLSVVVSDRMSALAMLGQCRLSAEAVSNHVSIIRMHDLVRHSIPLLTALNGASVGALSGVDTTMASKT